MLALPVPVLQPWEWRAPVPKRPARMQTLAVLEPLALARLPIPRATRGAEAHPFRLQLLGLEQLPTLKHVQEEVLRRVALVPVLVVETSLAGALVP